MGLITTVWSSLDGATTGVTGVKAETLSALGISKVMGLVLAVTLLYLLAYLNLLEAAEADRSTREKVVVLVIPLLFAFAATVVYHSLQALRWEIPT